ncbi:MAG: FeoB-associated Cys-rich membrane protein [Muribaculaceae bacterium]
MSDWWQILAVLAIAVGAIWLLRRSRRRSSDSCSCGCDDCPLSPSCRKKS